MKNLINFFKQYLDRFPAQKSHDLNFKFPHYLELKFNPYRWIIESYYLKRKVGACLKCASE